MGRAHGVRPHPRRISRVCLFAVLAANSVAAHEFDPAILTLTQDAGEMISVVWKAPARHVDYVKVSLPADCSGREDVHRQSTGVMILEHWSTRCVTPLGGSEVGVSFQRQLPIDVLLRVRFADGRHWSTILTGLQPSAIVPVSLGQGHSFERYVRLGVGHILFGWDHLLFVLGLLLIVSNLKWLLVTITGFTIGHSVTLGFAALGWLVVPSAPVEACIALSVVLLAREVIVGQGDSLTRRYPWFVAGAFGLLHGLGFGNALLEIGLPEQGLWRPLLAFNIGVEVGQVIFITFVLLAVRFLKMLWRSRAIGTRTEWLGYPIGIVAMFWFLERLSL